MVRGKAEASCLALARKQLLNGDAGDISSSGWNNCYGFTLEDKSTLAKVLSSCHENSDNNAFPDFVCEDGIVEHFRISSSKTTRKGQEHKIKRSLSENDFAEESDRVKREAAESPGAVVTGGTSFLYPEHTHEFLLESIEKEFSNHANHLSGCSGQNDADYVVFLIDYDDAALCMCENSFSAETEGRWFGQLQRQERLPHYVISRDKEALKWLYGQRGLVDCVVFVTPFEVEAIALEGIPGLINLLPHDYKVAPLGSAIERHFVASVAIPGAWLEGAKNER